MTSFLVPQSTWLFPGTWSVKIIKTIIVCTKQKTENLQIAIIRDNKSFECL